MNGEIDLKKFEDYLSQTPPKGSSAPPRTVPAKVLDKNFKKVTLIEDSKPQEDNDRTYKINYTDDGTVLKLKYFPKGKTLSDLAYWDPNGGGDNVGQWTLLPAIESSVLHVLGLKEGILSWVSTVDCEEEEA